MASRARLLLTWALGGLVGLTAITGVTALVVFQRIWRGETTLRARLMERSRALEQIRAGVYLSGTLARDYFIAPTEPESPLLLQKLKRLEEETSRAVVRYSAVAEISGEGNTASLNGEIAAYWKLLDLMADLASSRRTSALDIYFRHQLAQRRETMTTIAESIRGALDREWNQGEAQSAATYGRLRASLIAEISLVIGLSILVSVATRHRLVRLESDARTLSAQLVQAQEQERKSIARELHDEVGQSLSSLLLDVGSAARLDDSGEIRVRLRFIAGIAERSVESVRRIALSLRPSMLDDLGLVAALEWQAREVCRRSGIEVEVRAEESAGELPDPPRTCIYRVAQEALHNCVRHSGARQARVELERSGGWVRLRIEDDGKGFVPGRTRGLGLLGMEERVSQLGGRFRVHTEPGRGTTVFAELPA